MLNRREFITAAGAAALGLAAGGLAARAAFKPARRWRGFNLLEKFTLGGNRAYVEKDFEMIAGWGFNFVRLPLDYRCWSAQGSGERALNEIDQAVEWGKQYGIHVNLNFHRAPGYCVNAPKEALDLWNDPRALDLCAAEWRKFAARYKGIPSERVSFDLLNEPADCGLDKYENVVRRLIEEIRDVDPGRLIVVDGYKWGNEPVLSLAGLGIWQSLHNYRPMEVSHYKADWIKMDWKTAPAWPLALERAWKDQKTGETKTSRETWDAARLRKEVVEPWQALEKQGVGVHVGEFGVYNQTPHDVALRYLGDSLALWREAGWGWSLWEFRGAFGVLESNRKDVKYEDYQGLKLDRNLLELLRQG